MSYEELIQLLIALDNSMDNQVLDFQKRTEALQAQIYQYLLNEIGGFDVENGKLKSGRYLNPALIRIDNGIYEILRKSLYDKSVEDFINYLPEIQKANIDLHERYNGININPTDISAANKQLYKLTADALTIDKGIRQSFIEPTKALILQQVLTGQTMIDARRMLREWNNNDLRNGKGIINGTPTPTLNHYAVQISRDTAYGVDRTTNHIVKENYQLDYFAYVGGIIKDSRPLCVYLVNLRRHIRFDELPPLLRRFPDGLYPNTTEDNFCQYCGGYACRHKAFPVRAQS